VIPREGVERRDGLHLHDEARHVLVIPREGVERLKNVSAIIAS